MSLTSAHAALGMYDGLTGRYLGVLNGMNFDLEGVCIKEHWGSPVVSWNGGHLYYSEGSFNPDYCPESTDPIGNIIRFNNDGTQAPWPGTGRPYVSGMYNGDQHTRGHTAGPDGSLYAMHYAEDLTGSLCPNCTLFRYPSDATAGWVKAYGVSRIVDGEITDPLKVLVYGAVAGVKADLKGNLYVGARVRPVGRTVPDFITTDSLSGAPDTHGSQYFWAYQMYGSIVKFDSTGGQLTVFGDDGKVLTAGEWDVGYSHGTKKYVRPTGGFQWAHYGVSHILSHASPVRCFCNTIRFDVDLFGRIFYPNTFMFEMAAMDNNRNMIFRTKNRDIPEVEIGLGHQIEVTDRKMYVADWMNNQIAVFDLAAGETFTSDAYSITAASESAAYDPSGFPVSVTSNPNPFNPATIIRVCLPAGAAGQRRAALRIYDIRGRQVADLSSHLLPSTLYLHGDEIIAVPWDASGLASGVYIVRLESSGISHRHRMFFLR